MRQYPQDRQFLFPFILGGLAGGALTSVTRPRPVYVNPSYGYVYPNYSYPQGPYGNYSYSYYYPYPR